MSTFQDLVSLVLLIFCPERDGPGYSGASQVGAWNQSGRDERSSQQIHGGSPSAFCKSEAALKLRGLDITALENINKEDFRHLLDGISFADEQLKGNQLCLPKLPSTR